MRTPVSVPMVRAPRKRGRRDKADPCTIVIFGGAGDLTKRKLIPAIYYLAEQKLLPDNFALLGVARDQNTDDGYRRLMREAMASSDEIHKIRGVTIAIMSAFWRGACGTLVTSRPLSSTSPG